MRVSQAQLKQALSHLQAGDWQSAHEIVQKDEESALACWAHGIVHIMEGDIPNARYWYRQADRDFPAQACASVEVEALARALGSIIP